MLGKKKIVLNHISTEKMIANSLTKPIPREIFQERAKILRLRKL